MGTAMKLICIGLLCSSTGLAQNQKIIECERVEYGNKVSFKFLQEYDDFEEETLEGYGVFSISHGFEYEQMSVYEADYPLSAFGITDRGGRLQFRAVSLDEVDLGNGSLMGQIRINPFDLSGLKKYGIALVTEFTYDEETGAGEVRSLQAIGNSASIYDDLHNYKLKNCVKLAEVPSKHLSNQEFVEL